MSLNEKFIIDLQGNNYVTYEGLVDLAHQNNLSSIYVELLQIPKDENNMTALSKATATTDTGTFSDIGAASPKSVNTTVMIHVIRITSTRLNTMIVLDILSFTIG